jgi:hypothetical protein
MLHVLRERGQHALHVVLRFKGEMLVELSIHFIAGHCHV